MLRQPFSIKKFVAFSVAAASSLATQGMFRLDFGTRSTHTNGIASGTIPACNSDSPLTQIMPLTMSISDNSLKYSRSLSASFELLMMSVWYPALAISRSTLTAKLEKKNCPPSAQSCLRSSYLSQCPSSFQLLRSAFIMSAYVRPFLNNPLVPKINPSTPSADISLTTSGVQCPSIISL